PPQLRLPFHSSFRLSLSLESLLCRGAPGCAALLDSIYFRIKSLQIKMSTANESVLKKTDIQQLQITELSEDNTRKKQKGVMLDHLNMFLIFLSNLTDDQKSLVRKLGFGSILHISCNSNVDDLFHWLAAQFNTSTCIIKLENGFKFQFTDNVVHKILGIPCGGLRIHTIPTDQTVQFMNTFLQSANATQEHIFSMISPTTTKEDFSRIFMLLALSILIAPNSKGVPTKKFFNALVDIDSDLDTIGANLPCPSWYIKLKKSDIRNNPSAMPGGCKLILVVMHFEFLITSEYKIPCNTFPRLPMWSSTMLNALLALDTMPGVKTQFGRLPMKHIYSTPFHDEPNVIELELLETVLHYINTKFPSIHNVEEKARVERSTRKFWQTFISNSVPTLQSYIDEAHSGFGLQNPSQANRTDEPTTSHFLPIVKSNNTAADPSLYKLKMEDHSVLESFLSSIDFTDFPGPHILPATFDEKNTKVSVEYLIQSFSESLHIDKHIDFHLLMPNASSFTTALLGTDVIKLNGQTKTDIGGSTTFQVILDTIKSDQSVREMNGKDFLQCRQEKFSISQWKFISNNKADSLYCTEDQVEVPAVQLHSSLVPSHNYEQAELQMKKAGTTDTKTGYSYSIGNNFEHDIPSFNAITESLHDALPHQLTASNNTSFSMPNAPNLIVNSTSNYPMLPNQKSPFLYSNSPLRPFSINSGQAENRFGTPLDDPGLYKLLEDYELECKRNEMAEGKKKLFQKFSSTSVVYQNKSMQYQQVIFSSPVQSEFYKTMNAALSTLDSSQRIFQVNEVWVDQKTLTISFRPGCWMSPHSLDCHSKILNTNQLFHGRQGLIPNTDAITHIVQREDMELFMRPMLNHSDPISRDILSEGRVGFSPDIANFVHLPCFNDKQWISISTNLDSGKYFDIMNPNGSGQDKFTTIISTVAYNFKTLFA
uniref:Uncharacterized protein n=3 Tax=Aegilops tauschii subsp. strangulata TaxID=200361 RepID=A0A453NXT6_AEGTS